MGWPVFFLFLPGTKDHGLGLRGEGERWVMAWDRRRSEQWHSFPRLQARIYELRRSASLQELNAQVAKDGGYDSHHFAYVNALAEIEEIEALLGWYGAWVSRRPWAGWQSWLVLGAALVSGILSVLAMWRG